MKYVLMFLAAVLILAALTPVYAGGPADTTSVTVAQRWVKFYLGTRGHNHFPKVTTNNAATDTSKLVICWNAADTTTVATWDVVLPAFGNWNTPFNQPVTSDTAWMRAIYGAVKKDLMP